MILISIMIIAKTIIIAKVIMIIITIYDKDIDCGNYDNVVKMKIMAVILMVLIRALILMTRTKSQQYEQQ